MLAVTETLVPKPELNRTEIQTRVNQLRANDNLRNWLDVIRELFILAAVFGLTVGCHVWRMRSGASWIWDVPILFFGVLLMGLAHHRISIIGHEASHYTLFRNRLLNEVVSNWCCMYGLISSTHLYRLQHMAHHQFVNDPGKDPDLLYMSVMGAKYQHPYGRGRFIREIVIPLLLSIPAQIKYIMIRAKIASFGGGYGPYAAQRKQRKALTMIHGCYLAAVIVASLVGIYFESVWMMVAVPTMMALGMGALESRIPEEWYMKSAIRPVISQRWDLYQRLLYFTLVFVALALLTHMTKLPWPVYYLLLWFVPLGTSFPFLMMVREEVQHTNAGQERFRHTRNFVGNPLIRVIFFPLNMGYHLEHHLYPMVPHYNLAKLNNFLRENDDGYRQAITTVDGHLLPRRTSDECASTAADPGS